MPGQILNIYASGVGGFGIGALTRVLTVAARASGLAVLGSETHGLAQRGGVVTATLRIGPDILGSPLIVEGEADIVAALEPLEALRAMPYLRPGGVIVYNTEQIQPLNVRLKAEKYPALEEIEKELRRVTERVHPIPASGLAKELGLSQAVNIILIGALARQGVLPFGLEAVREAVRQTTPKQFTGVNLKALELG